MRHKRTAWNRSVMTFQSSIRVLRNAIAKETEPDLLADYRDQLREHRSDKASMVHSSQYERKRWLFQRGHHNRVSELVTSLDLLRRLGTITPKTELTIDQIKDKKLLAVLAPVIEKTGDQNKAVINLVAYLSEHTDPGMMLSVLRSFIGLDRLIMEGFDELPEMASALDVINWVVSMAWDKDFDNFDRDVRLKTEPSIHKLLTFPRYG